MKKLVLLCFFLFAFGAAFILLICYAKDPTINGGNMETMKATGRNLKENDHESGLDDNGYEEGDMIEDYRPIDPVPSSKAVRPGPIQHATPLMPYIPKPSPPNHPKHGNYP
ncbi:hypothetical protein Dimus_004553 [Dionaea muscipula]